MRQVTNTLTGRSHPWILIVLRIQDMDSRTYMVWLRVSLILYHRGPYVNNCRLVHTMESSMVSKILLTATQSHASVTWITQEILYIVPRLGRKRLIFLLFAVSADTKSKHPLYLFSVSFFCWANRAFTLLVSSKPPSSRATPYSYVNMSTACQHQHRQ